MSAPEDDAPRVPAPPEPGEWGNTLVRDRIWLRFAALAVVVIAVVWYAVIDFNDHAFANYTGAAAVHATAGQTEYLGLPLVPTGGRSSLEVNLRTAAPRIAKNSAGATVAVMVCSGASSGALINGAAAGSADACTALTPFQRGTVTLSPTSGLVLAVTLQHAGVVHIKGADVHYWRGIRFGHQHVGTDWTVAAP